MPGYVQSNKNTSTHAATVSATFTSNNIAGNLLVVACGIWTNPLSVSVSDTQGNTYVVHSALTGTSSGSFVWYAANCKAGANTVTVTKAVNANQDMDLIIAEYSGYAALDTFGTNAVGATTNVTASLTLAGAGELLVAFTYDQTHNNQTWTLSPSAGWTLRQQTANPDGAEAAFWDQIYGLSGAYSLTATLSAVPTAQQLIVLAFIGAAPPSIVVSPAGGKQGNTVTLTVTGTNTHFATGTTTVSVSGSGVTAGTPSVASATSLTVSLTISPTAAATVRTITVTTGSEAPTATFAVVLGQRDNIDYDQIQVAVRQGSGGMFQMFAGSAPVSGHVAVYDASGNVIDGGSGPGGSGTVTSVALTMPTEFSVAGSPVTSSGTLAVTKANESANTVWAGPSSGAAAPPTFRSLAAADVSAAQTQSDWASSTAPAAILNKPPMTYDSGTGVTAVNSTVFTVLQGAMAVNPVTPATGYLRFGNGAGIGAGQADPVISSSTGVLTFPQTNNLTGANFTDPTKITFGSNWANWTPTFAAYPGDGMTITVGSLYDAQYLRIGPIVYFKLRMGLTFGGTFTNRFQVTGLPVSLVGDVSGINSQCNAGGPYIPGQGYIAIISSATALVIGNASAFTAATWVFIIHGVYRCA